MRIVFIIILCSIVFNCKEDGPVYEWKTKEVTASAFNSLAYQTSSNPSITAFGDSLKPGIKCIAVSRNLLNEGFEHNTQVKIEGLEGIYLVKDKMNKRYRDKIDIYMGVDVKAARKWGRKKLTISYRIEIPQDSLD